MKAHRTSFLIFTFSFLTCFFLPAMAFSQTAAELDALLETETVSAAVAARFALGAVGLLPPELSGSAAQAAAYDAALSRGWVESGPDGAISLQETAFLIMNAFGLKGGIMYSLAHSPRYAYREMVYRRLIQGRAYSNMTVSGKRLLQIIGLTLNYTGEREQMDEIITNSEAQR